MTTRQRPDTAENVDVAIPPFYRPPRRPQTQPVKFRRGRCYQYVFQEMLAWRDAGEPAPTMRVIHGIIRTPTFERVKPAWIERGARAYDWQMLAHDRIGPIPVAEFYARFAPTECIEYDLDAFCAISLRAGHHGPWTEMAP